VSKNINVIVVFLFTCTATEYHALRFCVVYLIMFLCTSCTWAPVERVFFSHQTPHSKDIRSAVLWCYRYTCKMQVKMFNVHSRMPQCSGLLLFNKCSDI